MKFKIDLKIFIFLIIFLLTRQIEVYATIMFFAIIHELGHLLAGVLLGMKPEKMEIKPYGISISFKILYDDYNKKIKQGNLLEIKKIIVALAGPITNAIIVLSTWKIEMGVFNKILIIYSNILLILFNLLPIYPLDGGRILNGILHIQFGKRKAEKYINSISFVCLVLLTLVGSILVYSLKNISIFLIIVCLWAMYIKQDLIYRRRNKIYYLVEKTIENN